MAPELSQIKEAQHSLRRTTHWLQTCPDDHVPDAYLDVVRAAERMFGLEQQLMERYEFPIRQLHLEQHARVLRGLHCVHCAVMDGASDRGRRAGGQLLMDWLHLHNDTLDAAFGLWIDYCQHGLVDPQDPCSSGRITAH